MRKSHMHMLLQASTHDTVAAATAEAHLHPQVRDALRVGLPAWFTYFLLATTRANTRSWTGVAILERRDLTPPLPCARAPTGRKAKWDVPVVAGRSVCPHNSPISRSGPPPICLHPPENFRWSSASALFQSCSRRTGGGRIRESRKIPGRNSPGRALKWARHGPRGPSPASACLCFGLSVWRDLGTGNALVHSDFAHGLFLETIP